MSSHFLSILKELMMSVLCMVSDVTAIPLLAKYLYNLLFKTHLLKEHILMGCKVNSGKLFKKLCLVVKEIILQCLRSCKTRVLLDLLSVNWRKSNTFVLLFFWMALASLLRCCGIETQTQLEKSNPLSSMFFRSNLFCENKDQNFVGRWRQPPSNAWWRKNPES